MAVDPNTLSVTQGGELDLAVMFPGVQDALALVAAYVADGQSRVSAWVGVNGAISTAHNDEAVRAWAYYRAWKFFHNQMVANPARAEISDQGGHQYLKEQVAAAATTRDEWRAEYDRVLERASVAVDKVLSETHSTHHLNRYIP